MAPEQNPDREEPYVGPRPFEEKDQDVFFGRDQEVNELVSLITSHPIVLLYSQSGAGKTSLLKASLIPLLKRREFKVFPPARVRGQERAPVEAATANNVYVYNALRYLSESNGASAELSKMTLARFVPPQQPTSKRDVLPLRVIIFDQFEEIFTVHPERYEDRQNLFEQVRDALIGDPLLRIVFAMREDYIAELDPYNTILPEKLQTRYRLMRLNESNARAAIEGPLTKPGRSESIKYTFEPKAATKLVNNLRTVSVKIPNGERRLLGPYIEPVQLQVVCQMLWRKLAQAASSSTDTKVGEVRITESDVDEFGNVNEALSEFYEQSLQSAVIAANGQESRKGGILTEGALRAWFARTLITAEVTRGTVFGGRTDDAVSGIPKAAVNELERQRIIRTELRGGELWYELSHDRFIQPIRDSNERWLAKQPLAQQKGQALEARASEWIRQGKNVRLLLNQHDFQDARRWMESPEGAGIGVSEILFAYIQASNAAHQQRRVRQLVAGACGLAVLIILMVGVSVYAFEQRRTAQNALVLAQAATNEAQRQTLLAEEAASEAEREKRVAEAAATEAEKQKLFAEEKRKEAEVERARAEEQREIANKAKAQAEVAERNASASRDEAIKQAALALSETKRANQINSDLEAANARLKELGIEEHENELRANLRSLPAIALSRSVEDPQLGALLAWHSVSGLANDQKNRVVTREGLTALRQTLQASLVKGPALSQSAPVMSLAFNSDGTTLSTASSDGAAKVWNIETGEADPTKGVKEDPQLPRNSTHIAISSIAVSPENRLLAFGRETGDVEVWNLDTGKYDERYDKITHHRHPVHSLGFSSDGNLLASATVMWNWAVADLEARKRLYRKPGLITLAKILYGRRHNHLINGFAFSEDKKLLATAAQDGTTEIREAHSGRLLSRLRGHKDAVLSVAFNNDGTRLVTTSRDKTAKIWEVSRTLKTNSKHEPLDSSPLFTLKHEDAITGVAFSPDKGGKLIATASQDRTAKVWSADSGKELVSLPAHKDYINAVAFSRPDKSNQRKLFLATGSSDNTTRLWDLSDLENVAGILEELRRLQSTIPEGKDEIRLSEDMNSFLYRARKTIQRQLKPDECKTYLRQNEEDCKKQVLEIQR